MKSIRPQLLPFTSSKSLLFTSSKTLLLTSACVLLLPCIALAQTVSNPPPASPTQIAASTNSTDSAALPAAPEPTDPNIDPQTEPQAQSQPAPQTQSAPPQQTSPQQTPPANQQQQPPAANEPSLQDLGITPSQTHGSAQQQALLDKRTHMLKVHQTLGLITVAPLAATLITGPMAKAKGKKGQTITEPTDANLDTHIALGALTTGLYWTSAYYAAFAPRAPGAPKKRGGIRLHEILVWIHAPGMILTPALGIEAWKQENSGEKVHGLASAHSPVAWVTAGAYGASIIAVSWPIHLKF